MSKVETIFEIVLTFISLILLCSGGVPFWVSLVISALISLVIIWAFETHLLILICILVPIACIWLKMCDLSFQRQISFLIRCFLYSMLVMVALLVIYFTGCWLGVIPDTIFDFTPAFLVEYLKLIEDYYFKIYSKLRSCI